MPRWLTLKVISPLQRHGFYPREDFASFAFLDIHDAVVDAVGTAFVFTGSSPSN